MQPPPRCPVTDVDIWSDEVLADPYPTYRELRHLGPVVWLAPQGVAALPRFGEVRAALADWRTFSSAQGVSLAHRTVRDHGHNILESDPPEHTHYRDPLNRTLTGNALDDEVEAIELVADRFVDRLLAADAFDAVTDLAAPFSVKVVMDLLGLPDDDREAIAPLGERAFNVMGPSNDRHHDGITALGHLQAITYRDLGALRPGGHGDRLVGAGHAEALITYTWPGIDTTVHALSSALFELAHHPDQWDLIRADPGLIPSLFNETLRLHAPVQTFGRVTASVAVIDDVELPEGTRVAVMMGSANRDERHYHDPDRFDVTRNPTDHLAFGRGVHRCVGLGLARIEAHSLFAALARRVARFELRGEPVWKPNNALHGLAALPLSVVAA